jgi:glycosyltransferase involved in cell wall biosynthesis
VSVVITTYNLGWCIAETLENVLAQTYPHLEVIVVDDASTDDTSQRVTPFLSRIRYIRHEQNLGIARGAEAGPARNTGIRAARGELIAMMDGDDLWHPDKISVQVAAAQRFPDAGMIVTDGIAFAHETGDTIRSTLLFDYHRDRFFASLATGAVARANLYEQTLSGCPVDTPSQMLFRRRVFDVVGLYADLPSDDYEFLIRASERFDTVVVKRPLVRYRVHAANLSGAIPDQFFRFTLANIRIWKHHATGRGRRVRRVTRERIRQALAQAAIRAATRGRAGERRWAFGYLGRLVRENWRSAAAPYVALRASLLLLPQRLGHFAEPILRRWHRKLIATSSCAIVGCQYVLDAMPV